MDTEMLDDVYTLDDHIVSFLRDWADPNILNIIENIVGQMDGISNVGLDLPEFETRELEDELLNIIVRDDAFYFHGICVSIFDRVKSTTLKYFNNIGIELDEDITYYNLLNIIVSFKSACLATGEESDDIVRTISGMEIEENQYILASILSDYCSISHFELYEMINEVSDTLLFKIRDKHLAKIEMETNELSDVTMSEVEILLNYDHRIGETGFMRNLLFKGYEYSNLLDNLDTMYYNILKHTKPVVNLDMVALEIFVTLYMSKDTYNNMEEMYKEYIHLDTIDSIGSVTQYITAIDTKVIELIRNKPASNPNRRKEVVSD